MIDPFAKSGRKLCLQVGPVPWIVAMLAIQLLHGFGACDSRVSVLGTLLAPTSVTTMVANQRIVAIHLQLGDHHVPRRSRESK